MHCRKAVQRKVRSILRVFKRAVFGEDWKEVAQREAWEQEQRDADGIEQAQYEYWCEEVDRRLQEMRERSDYMEDRASQYM